MRLENYLKETKIKRIHAATALGISPSGITTLCSPNGWPATRELAIRIQEWTRGAVTANDFVPPYVHKPIRSAKND